VRTKYPETVQNLLTLTTVNKALLKAGLPEATEMREFFCLFHSSLMKYTGLF